MGKLVSNAGKSIGPTNYRYFKEEFAALLLDFVWADQVRYKRRREGV